MPKFEKALAYLRKRFGKDKVLVRKSSSGNGYHVRVLCDLSPDAEMELRKKLGDCYGRRVSDKGRLDAGLKTSRLFKVKGIYKGGKTKIVKSKEWKSEC